MNIQTPTYYNPEVWGPPYWFFLHTIALTYPHYPNANTKKIYYNFFRNFSLFIPVEAIAKEYEHTILHVCPIVPYLDDRKSLVKWILFLHNHINKKLEKPTLSMNEFLYQYNRLYVPKPKKNMEYLYWKRRIVYCLVMISLILLIFYLMKK